MSAWPLHPIPEPPDDDGRFRKIAELLARETDPEAIALVLKILVTLWTIEGEALKTIGANANMGAVLRGLGVDVDALKGLPL